MRETSSDLLQRASEGDEFAVEELLQRYLPSLREYLGRELGAAVRAKESPEDLAQSVCREILQHIGRFQYRGEDAFRNWLFTSALRKIKDKHRYYFRERRDVRKEVPIVRRDSRTDAGLRELFASIGSPSQHALRQEEYEAAQAAFDQLSERYQRVIVLALVEQKTGAEIAGELNVTESNARRLLSRARVRLARLAAERLGER